MPGGNGTEVTVSAALCRESGQRADFSLNAVTETNRYAGLEDVPARPTAALITCWRCHRPGLRARVYRILPEDHGYAIVPHHYTRKDPE